MVRLTQTLEGCTRGATHKRMSMEEAICCGCATLAWEPLSPLLLRLPDGVWLPRDGRAVYVGGGSGGKGAGSASRGGRARC